MNTDQTQDGLIQIPEIIPPRVKRKSGIHQRLLEKLHKSSNFLKALKFAEQILSYGTRPRAAVKSVMTQHGLNTREARRAVKACRPKKHRSRS